MGAVGCLYIGDGLQEKQGLGTQSYNTRCLVADSLASPLPLQGQATYQLQSTQA